MDENNLPQEGTSPEVTVETTESTPEGETGDSQADVEVEEVVPKSQYDAVHGRATRAEAELKTLKGGKPAAAPAAPQVGVEETVLLANGMPEELVKELKVVAKARGINSLIKAQNDPIFVALKEKFEKEKKQKDASLPASRGSGAAAVPKTVSQPGLSREEHQRLAREALGA
jgi:hypothetical protein